MVKRNQVLNRNICFGFPLSLFAMLLFTASSWAQGTASLLNQGVEAYQEGDYAAAIEKFNQIIDQNAEAERAYYLRGVSYLQLGQLEKAVADYSNVIEINPKNGDAYSDRGIAYTQLGNYERAIADYNRALELKPKQAQERIYLNRGIAYSQQRNLERAIADYTEAITINQEFADAYANRGVTQAAMGDKTSAIEDLETAANLYRKQGKESLYQRVQQRLEQLQ